MRKLVMILAMAMVAFGSFAKDFEYKADKEWWSYWGNLRELVYHYESDTFECYVYTYDVSEEDAWKIINGEEFPTYELNRVGCDTSKTIFQIPARDYSNRR